MAIANLSFAVGILLYYTVMFLFLFRLYLLILSAFRYFFLFIVMFLFSLFTTLYLCIKLSIN